jgi:hypothetical protein
LTYLVRFVICCLKYGVINDELYDRIRCSELRKWHFRGSNFKNFPGGNARLGPPNYARFWSAPRQGVVATVRVLGWIRA